MSTHITCPTCHATVPVPVETARSFSGSGCGHAFPAGHGSGAYKRFQAVMDVDTVSPSLAPAGPQASDPKHASDPRIRSRPIS